MSCFPLAAECMSFHIVLGAGQVCESYFYKVPLAPCMLTSHKLSCKSYFNGSKCSSKKKVKISGISTLFYWNLKETCKMVTSIAQRTG